MSVNPSREWRVERKSESLGLEMLTKEKRRLLLSRADVGR